MGGEIGINVVELKIDECMHSKYSDLLLKGDRDDRLYICGENDWAFLMLDALKPIKEKSKNLMRKVLQKRNAGVDIKAIVLGKTEKRYLDIYFGGKGKCNKLYGYPIVESPEKTCFEILVKHDDTLPF